MTMPPPFAFSRRQGEFKPEQGLWPVNQLYAPGGRPRSGTVWAGGGPAQVSRWQSPTQMLYLASLSPAEVLKDIEATMEALSPGERCLVDRAAEMANAAYGGRRQTVGGRLKIEHAADVAWTVARLGLNAGSVAAAWLHDVIEDEALSSQTLEKHFPSDVCRLVQAMSKPSARKGQSPADLRRQAYQKIVRSAYGRSDTLPAAVIKIAEVWSHLCFTAPSQPACRRQDMALEANCRYAPLAERLGLSEFKRGLQDLAFSCAHPAEYEQVRDRLAERQMERNAALGEAVATLEEELARLGLQAWLECREKNASSTYSKMKRKSMGWDDVQDLLGVRIVVPQDQDCFPVLDLVHSLWLTIPETFDDYITTPKTNNYQSLHTAVQLPAGFALEVQIRSWRMHCHAEWGRAAHWRYSQERGDALALHSGFCRRPARDRNWDG